MSDGESQALSFVYLAGCLVLVGSAFLVRRIPIAQGLKMALAWALIFFAAFAVFALRDDFAALGSRLLGEARGDPQMVRSGSELRIKMSDDGHFWVNAEVNGKKVRFLVDSGATVTGISAETARDAGVDVDSGSAVLVETANGTVAAQRARADSIAIGSIEQRDQPIFVFEGDHDTDVLGMSFLSSLSGWGVEGQWLILRP